MTGHVFSLLREAPQIVHLVDEQLSSSSTFWDGSYPSRATQTPRCACRIGLALDILDADPLLSVFSLLEIEVAG